MVTGNHRPLLGVSLHTPPQLCGERVGWGLRAALRQFWGHRDLGGSGGTLPLPPPFWGRTNTLVRGWGTPPPPPPLLGHTRGHVSKTGHSRG